MLKWALPRLGLAWPGFRRVHRQVCKRIGRRLKELHLGDALAYRSFLEAHPEEWAILDSFCWISISRFFRDGAVFDCLGQEILPQLAASARAQGRAKLQVCSLGCAAGEEPYSLSLLWRFRLLPSFPELSLSLLAVDADSRALQRAQAGCYSKGSFKELPAGWLDVAFSHTGGRYCLKLEFRAGIEFRRQDIRQGLPPGLFDLILCRNLAFTYFSVPSQARVLQRIVDALRPAGVLIIGRKESLSAERGSLQPWLAQSGIFRKAPLEPLRAKPEWFLTM
jgi:chemotaxis protein methyltransferase CheR